MGVATVEVAPVVAGADIRRPFVRGEAVVLDP